jgi:SAM-dependent methyltransferase
MESLAELDEVIARHFALSLVARLLNLGLFDSLARGATSNELATACNVDPQAFEAAIGFAVRFSGLLTNDADNIRFSDFVVGSGAARFRILKFFGVYQPCILNFGEARPADALLALAYRQWARRSPVALVSYIMELKPRRVLEIGCGSAPVLRALANLDVEVCGLAVDSDSNMVALARELVTEQQLAERVTVAEATLSDVADRRPHWQGPFDVIVLRSVLNETFSDGSKAAAILTRLAATHRGAQIVVCEYLSKLGTPQGRESGPVQTLTHDLVQVLSGQGLPPSMLEGWDDIYNAAGLQRLARRVDNSVEGVTQFIDLIVANPRRKHHNALSR